MVEVKLQNPLEIDGESIEVLHFDFDQLSAKDFFKAELDARTLGEITPNIQWGSQYRAVVAAMACKENIKFEDIRDIMTFKDAASVTGAVGDFLLGLD